MQLIARKGLDYKWWYKINESSAWFIKSNTAFKVIADNTIDTNDAALIVSDQVIHLSNKKPRAGAFNHYALKDLL